jgi:hypothetical protein
VAVMDSHTDIIVSCLLFIFFYTGWRKGLFRVILGPLSLIIASFFALLEYDLSRDLFKALSIVAIGTIGLSLTGHLFLFVCRRTTDQKFRGQTFILSRLLGGALNVAWKGFILAILFWAIVSFPLNVGIFKTAKEDINRSRTLSIFNTTVLPYIPTMKKFLNTTEILVSPSRLPAITQTREYKEFVGEKDVAAILADEGIKKMVEQKNYIQLMANPKVKNFLQNKESIEKLGRLTRRIYKEDQNKAVVKDAVGR